MYEAIDKHIKQAGTPCCIIIAGMSCSGKTTLAQKIKEHYKEKYETTIIHQDDWYKNLDDVPKSKDGYLMDSINAFDRKGFRDSCEDLLKNGKAEVPMYNMERNVRMADTVEAERGDINIFEGLHAITLLSTLNDGRLLMIYTDTPPSACLERRIERDALRYCGSTPEKIKKIWKTCILPMSDCYVWSQRQFADIVVKPGQEG